MPFERSASGLILPKDLADRRELDAVFANVEVFARNGRVILRRPTKDGSDMDEKSLAIEQATHRRNALVDEWKELRELGIRSKVARAKAEVTAVFISRLSDTIEAAKEQGPFEYEDMRRARVRARPVSISMRTEK